MKTILTIDYKRYDCKRYFSYVDTVNRIFKYKHIKLVDEKIDLINQICQELPIVLIGEPRNIKIRSIINVINLLLFVQNGEKGSLAYTTKKARVVKDKQEHYVNAYSFYFVSGDKKWVDLK